MEDWVAGGSSGALHSGVCGGAGFAGVGFSQQREREEGRPPYANDLLLKIWLYGYLGRIRATRQLEQACKEHLSLLWLTGLNEPDHNTLWRFWRGEPAGVAQGISGGVKVAAEQGLIGMICHAVDGTKIASRGVAADGGASGRFGEAAGAGGRGVGGDGSGRWKRRSGRRRAITGLPEDCRRREKLRAAIRESLGKMDEAEREHLHPQEPEARLMPCEGRKDPAYNAQAMADAKAEIIVAQTAVNAESDNAQLVPMLEETKANLGAVAGRRWRMADTLRRSSWGRPGAGV